MLTRIISGTVGALLLAVVLYFHATLFLPIAVSAIVAIMLFEMIRAVKLEKCLPVIIPAEACGISIPIIYSASYYRDQIQLFSTNTPALYPFNKAVPETVIEIFGWTAQPTDMAFAITMLCVFIVFVTWLAKHKDIHYDQVFVVIGSMAFIPQAMATMVRTERYDSRHGLFLLVMALCGAWIADTGAYFTGVAFGKHKLCPEISPKKTIEGFVGGIVITGIVFAAAFGLYAHFNKNFEQFNTIGYIALFIMGALCAVVGAIGDLSASMIKRQIGIKDYGKIMPGHGGLMDRFDSVLFVLPTFYAFITLTRIF